MASIIDQTLENTSFQQCIVLKTLELMPLRGKLSSVFRIQIYSHINKVDSSRTIYSLNISIRNMNTVILSDVYKAGVKWASELQPGQLFEGCGVEARKRYAAFPDGIAKSAIRLFISGAMDVLERKTLCIDQAGYITSL